MIISSHIPSIHPKSGHFGFQSKEKSDPNLTCLILVLTSCTAFILFCPPIPPGPERFIHRFFFYIFSALFLSFGNKLLSQSTKESGFLFVCNLIIALLRGELILNLCAH